MKYKVTKISKEVWEEKYAANAYVSVFEEPYNPEQHTCDFGLLVSDNTDNLISYATIKNLNKTYACMEYGGSFPDKRGSTHVIQTFLVMIDWLQENGYKKLFFVTRNDNYSMLKFGLTAGFKITGLTINDKKELLIEHTLELEERK